MTIPQVRRMMGDLVAVRILRLINLTRLTSNRPCPFCNKPMVLISIHEPKLALESCRACAVVWFDAPTYGLLPELATVSTNSLPMQATEIIALNRLRELKEREKEAQSKRKKRKRQIIEDSADGLTR
ncbi:MAG: hypothetical protein NTZ16_04080 [Verrucomicrobia bacterium]|nr:hypothetical protein [Verrucomicrobiota bacterium]